MKNNRLFFMFIVLFIFIITIVLVFSKKNAGVANSSAALSAENSSNIGSSVISASSAPKSSIAKDSSIHLSETQKKIAEIDKKLNDPFLKLVSAKYPLNKDYKPALSTISGSNKQIDSRILTNINKMISDAKKENVTLAIQSAYRSYATQNSLYLNKVAQIKARDNLTEEQAKIEAAKIVAVPSTSEHQYGLTADIVGALVSELIPEKEEKTAAFKWLMANSKKYGFILRYPKGKESITGIIYEPWHFRYVGVENSTVIMDKGITLEEYMDDLKKEKQSLA